MKKESKIIVFGAGGLIGSEIVKQLMNRKYTNVIASTHSMLDLTNQTQVNDFMEEIRPEYVFFCAVRSITNFEEKNYIDAVEMYSNIMMQLNVMEASRKSSIKKAIFLGSAMLYPWNDEHQNELLQEDFIEDFRIMQYRESMKSTVLSKYVSMKMCQYYYGQYGCKYIYAIPTHIYGNFEGRKNLYFLENLVKDLCDAKKNKLNFLKLDIFGEGKAKKQILHVRDCADAIITVLDKYEDYSSPINIGTAQPECWASIVKKICSIIDYQGSIEFNYEHKENMSNRICSTKKLEKLGWKQHISMDEGLKSLCEEYMTM